MMQCEDCGDDCKRRTRCKKCKLLICRWCRHHIHNAEIQRAIKKSANKTGK